MTLTDIRIPADQAEGTTSVVATWYKQVGDRVRLNEPLLELSTDKVTVEIAAPASGVLREILKPEGASVSPGEVVGRVSEGSGVGEVGEGSEVGGGSGVGEVGEVGEGSEVGEGREVSEGRSTAAGIEVGSVRVSSPAGALGAGLLSPAVRRLLKEHGLEAAQVRGTGRDGRITAEDVERAVADKTDRAGLEGEATATAGSHPEPRADARGRDLKARERAEFEIPRSARNDTGGLPSRMVPHSQMRKSIAAHMVHSVATAPHVTSVFDADLSRILLHRDRNKGEAEARGTKLTLTAYFVQATVRALQAVPEVNSRWHHDALELFDDCNVGIGTALEGGGLIVPVIHQAQSLDLLGTVERLQDLTLRARSGALTPPDVQHGTFTISNHGVSGSLVATPIIINQPQSAILGIGRLEKRVVVTEAYGHEVTEIRPMIYVTLTIDHRVLDGFQANRFLTEWVRVVEGWE